jgi:hypothetical protein
MALVLAVLVGALTVIEGKKRESFLPIQQVLGKKKNHRGTCNISLRPKAGNTKDQKWDILV